MVLKIYWYETGVLSTAKSAEAKERSGAQKSAEAARSAAANAAKIGASGGGTKFKVMLESGVGVSSNQIQTSQVFQRQVGSGSGGVARQTEEQRVVAQTQTRGVPQNVIRKRAGGFIGPPRPEEKPRRTGIPRGAAGLLAGAPAIAFLRGQTEEERRQAPVGIQVAQGVAEGVGGIGSIVVANPIAAAYDIRGLIEGRPERGAKEFTEFVQKELRPSTVSQGFSQINPFAEQREPVSFDPTSISRAVGELGAFAVGGPKIPVAKGGITATVKPGKFTSTKIKLPAEEGGVKSFLFKEGPKFDPEVYQQTARINLGEGIGKTKLREPLTRRSPFIDDKATRTSGQQVFGKAQSVGLGSGAVKIIPGGSQTQASGLQTIVKQSAKQSERPDILRQAPRFTEAPKRSRETFTQETIAFPKSTPKSVLSPVISQKSFTGTKELEKAGSEITGVRITQSEKFRDAIKLGTAGGAGLRFSEKVKTDLTRGTNLAQPEIFRFGDDVVFKLTPGTKQTYRFPPPPERIRPPTPRIEPPFLRPPRTTGFFPFIPRTSFGSYGSGGGRSQKKVFSTFGISEDINVKYLERVLPNTKLQRVSFSPIGISKKLAKEDRRAINLYYGVSTRRKSGKRKRKR